MNINMELYKVFLHVVKAGSISGAAETLFISQPAVSQSVKQLEEKLGGQLFFRTPRGIKLTNEGEVVYKYVEQAYNFILTAESKFMEMQNLLSGEIRISASDTLCKYYLAPHLGKFHKMYPKVHIRITNRTSIETIELLKKGIVDLGIINLPIQKDQHMLVKETVSIRDCFAAGEHFKAAAAKELELDELADYPLLMLEKTSNTRRLLDKYAKANGVTIIPEIELGSIDLLVEFAKTGLGIACVIKDFISDELEKGELYEVKLKGGLPERKIGIVTLSDVPLSTAAKEFMELLNDSHSDTEL